MRYHGATVLVTLLVMLSQSSASFSAEKDLDPSLYDTLIFLNEKLKQINVRYSRNFVILIDQQSDMLEISREVFSLERQEWLPDRFTAFIPLDEVVVDRAAYIERERTCEYMGRSRSLRSLRKNIPCRSLDATFIGTVTSAFLTH